MNFYDISYRTKTPFAHVKGMLFDGTTVDSLSAIISTNPYCLNEVLSNIDGEFAFVYTDSERMVVFSDGTRPLYVYTDSGIVGFSFEEEHLEIRGTPRLFPEGSYWTSDNPDIVFSVRRNSDVVPCTDVLDHVVHLLIRAVDKRVANKKAVVMQTDDPYSEMLSLVYNIASRSNPTSDRDVVILSTIGARSLFERMEVDRVCTKDERYTFPFLDRELVDFVRKLSFWSSDLTNMLYNRLFTI